MKWAWSTPAAFVLAAFASTSYAQEPKVFTGNLAQRAPDYVPDRLVVGFNESVTDAEAAQIVSGMR